MLIGCVSFRVTNYHRRGFAWPTRRAPTARSETPPVESFGHCSSAWIPRLSTPARSDKATEERGEHRLASIGSLAVSVTASLLGCTLGTTEFPTQPEQWECLAMPYLQRVVALQSNTSIKCRAWLAEKNPGGCASGGRKPCVGRCLLFPREHCCSPRGVRNRTVEMGAGPSSGAEFPSACRMIFSALACHRTTPRTNVLTHLLVKIEMMGCDRTG